jgi:hypothetical protein
MHARCRTPGRAHAALVIVPGNLNYFYDLLGRRVSESLAELGFAVDVATLAALPEGDYDWCLLTNIHESVLAYQQEAAATDPAQTARARERQALDAITGLHRRVRLVSCSSLDCVRTPWYETLCRRAEETGIRTVLDFGLHDQGEFLPPPWRARYHFVVNGLTAAERRALDEAEAGADSPRPIPWAFVGHATAARAALVDRLVQQVDPCGFVYMPGLAPYTEKGSPHLNQQQFEAVLRQTRYQVWCSHHDHFYMESERFRMSVLAGAVPVKVVPGGAAMPRGLCFEYLVCPAAEVTRRLRGLDFHQVRRRFRDDYRDLPGLAAGLAGFLEERGVLGPGQTGAPARDPWSRRVPHAA